MYRFAIALCATAWPASAWVSPFSPRMRTTCCPLPFQRTSTALKFSTDPNDPAFTREFNLVRGLTYGEVRQELQANGIRPPIKYNEKQIRLMLVELRLRKNGHMPEEENNVQQPKAEKNKKSSHSEEYNAVRGLTFGEVTHELLRNGVSAPVKLGESEVRQMLVDLRMRKSGKIPKEQKKYKPRQETSAFTKEYNSVRGLNYNDVTAELMANGIRVPVKLSEQEIRQMLVDLRLEKSGNMPEKEKKPQQEPSILTKEHNYVRDLTYKAVTAELMANGVHVPVKLSEQEIRQMLVELRLEKGGSMPKKEYKPKQEPPVFTKERNYVRDLTYNDVTAELMANGIRVPVKLSEQEVRKMLVEMRLEKSGNMPKKEYKPKQEPSVFTKEHNYVRDLTYNDVTAELMANGVHVPVKLSEQEIRQMLVELRLKKSGMMPKEEKKPKQEPSGFTKELYSVRDLTYNEVTAELLANGINAPVKLSEQEVRQMLVELRMKKNNKLSFAEKKEKPITSSAKFEQVLQANPAFAVYYNSLEASGDNNAQKVAIEYVNDPKLAEERYGSDYGKTIQKIKAALISSSEAGIVTQVSGMAPRAIEGSAGSRIRLIFGETGSEWLLLLDEDDGNRRWQSCFWNTIHNQVADQLNVCSNKGHYVKEIDFGSNGAWCVQGIDRNGVPGYSWWGNTQASDDIDTFIDESSRLQVFFGSDSNGDETSILLQGENGYCASGNLNDDLVSRIERLRTRNKSINFVRLFHNNGYFISDDEGAKWAGVGTSCSKALKNSKSIQDLAVAADGSWVIIGPDDFVCGGDVDKTLEDHLNRFYQEQTERMNLNSPEFQPDERVENEVNEAEESGIVDASGGSAISRVLELEAMLEARLRKEMQDINELEAHLQRRRNSLRDSIEEMQPQRRIRVEEGREPDTDTTAKEAQNINELEAHLEKRKDSLRASIEEMPPERWIRIEEELETDNNTTAKTERVKK